MIQYIDCLIMGGYICDLSQAQRKDNEKPDLRKNKQRPGVPWWDAVRGDVNDEWYSLSWMYAEAGGFVSGLPMLSGGVDVSGRWSMFADRKVQLYLSDATVVMACGISASRDRLPEIQFEYAILIGGYCGCSQPLPARHRSGGSVTSTSDPMCQRVYG